jgi:hypothetical protein
MSSLKGIVKQVSDWRSELNEIKALLLINHINGSFFPWDEKYREMSAYEHCWAVLDWQAKRIIELEKLLLQQPWVTVEDKTDIKNTVCVKYD